MPVATRRFRIVNAALTLLFAASTLAQAQPQRAALAYDPTVPPLRFAASELRAAFTHAGFIVIEGPAASAWSVELLIKNDGRPAQSYSIARKRNSILVTGADAAGAMYGGLDVAEAIRNGNLEKVDASEHKPHIARRGIKFNIPLDLRTPSYSDSGDAAQANIAEMWSFDFWREMLDEMARQRFNVLTLWNLHPFPSMVKVPEYPEVALADIQRTKVKFDDTFSHRGHDMVRPPMLQDVEVLKRMTIEDKIAFWRDVMQYAADRGIDTYVFTWNIFTFGAAGKHGITQSQSNPTTVDYFRKSVREMVLTYPLLKGIGITAGEQMEKRTDEFESEQWLWNTYGEGIRDALRLTPGREFRLIHRFHETNFGAIQSAWGRYPSIFDLSFKYAIAHMYSSPNPPFAKQSLAELPTNLRMWMTVRNDDIYSFRWADASFARAFIQHLPGPDKLAGFYMGPDGTIWGREVLEKDPLTPRELVFKRQWLSFMMWGRLSYEPSLPDELFTQALATRFPGVDAPKLYQASAAASKIIPQVTRFFWQDIDLKWLPEASLSHPRFKGFFTVKHFAENEPMPEAGVMSVKDFAAGKRTGQTPPEVAEALHKYSAEARALAAQLRSSAKDNRELRLTLGDIEAMSLLGDYYAEKILAATELTLGHRDKAVTHAEAELEAWKKYAAIYSSQYKPQLYNRMGFVDVNAITAKVAADIDLVKR